MEKLVEVFPNQLNLTPTKNTPYIESKLNIKNLTNNYVIFKIYNNNINIYSCKPSKSFIPPKETKDIYIKRFTKEEKGNDQFLLMFYSIDKIINNNDEVKDAFNSKIYNEKSELRITIPVSINNENKNELENIYNENDLKEVVDDNLEEIKIYNNLIENLKTDFEKTNQNIIQLEKILEGIKTQRQLKEEKERAITLNKNKKLNNLNKSYKNIILISIILIGLIFGANLACKYNKLFVYKPRIIKQIIINPSENYIQNKINEINNLYDRSFFKINNDFLTWRFFLVLYLICLAFVL